MDEALQYFTNNINEFESLASDHAKVLYFSRNKKKTLLQLKLFNTLQTK
jgi:hypothetical protein